jgi:DNA-binding transcriptional regulator YhcF (GntR family)
MEFRLDEHSPLPIVTQLQEQIKIALLLGHLRPGDTLPSIRDVEKQLGISRNYVRQAYVNLEQSGILTLRQGKGVMVQRHLNYAAKTDVMQSAETLASQVLQKAQRIGVVPSAFARYLYQRASEIESSQCPILYVDVGKQIATERAQKISSFWRMNIPAFSLEELAGMKRNGLRHVKKVLTNYWRYDEVRKMLKGTGVEKIIPLGLVFAPKMVAEFSKFPRNSSVLFVFDDQDYPALQLIMQPYKQILTDPSVIFTAKPLSKIRDLRALVKSARYRRVVISNRLWENIPEEIRHLPRVTRPQMEIDPSSLETARLEAGVIV